MSKSPNKNNTTSAQGRAFLVRHEGDVLRAYRCPAGRWTIGAGLTKASGVVAPRAGMLITRGQSALLLTKALARNYEPTVNAAMPGAQQHEFDGGVSFHWNTGAIKRASWVPKWRVENWAEVRRRLKMWVKGGGKVLPGLVRRREEEYALIFAGYYSEYTRRLSPENLSPVVVPLGTAKMKELRKALTDLGYQPGASIIGVEISAIKDFQRDHGLTADGVIGRATLSTVQRMLDARKKAKLPAAAGGVAAAETQVGAATDALNGLPGAEIAGWLALGFCALWLIKIGWQYRDAIAVKAQTRFPKIADKLRSF